MGGEYFSVEYVRSSKARPPLPDGPFLVVGLARSGVAAARALKAHGQAVFGVDSGEPEGLEVLRESGIDFETSVPGLDRLEGVTTVIKSPGVPESAEVIAEARRRGLAVMGELELGWRMFEAPVVAVLGHHDHGSGGPEVTHALERAGAPVLSNAFTTLTVRGQKLQIVGLDDAYTGHADRDRATRGLDPRVPSIGLSHNGDEKRYAKVVKNRARREAWRGVRAG